MPLFLLEIFCVIDDFCKLFDQEDLKKYLPSTRVRKRSSGLKLSEVMTILIYFHRSDYKTFKHFYLNVVSKEWKQYFPGLVGYSRFIQMVPQTLMPLTLFLSAFRGLETGVYYVDATPLKVCHVKREKKHKVFKGLAAKGKTSMGWFFGIKLHIIINQLGELMGVKVTPGNTDDRSPVLTILKNLQGWLFGDKGYLGQDFLEKLKVKGIDLFTRARKNMKKKILEPAQEYFLSKRGLIETVIDQLKNICQIEHSRHRSVNNAFVSIIAGLIAYQFKPRKPSLKTFKLKNNPMSLR